MICIGQYQNLLNMPPLFLQFLDSGSIANSHSKMFSHLILHLMNLLYKLSLTVQSILGPSMYGINALVAA